MNTFTAAGAPAFVASADYFARLGLAPVQVVILAPPAA